MTQISITKSCNNKLTRLEDSDKILYFSYETPIIMYVGSNIYVRENYTDYSSTTSRHIFHALPYNALVHYLNEYDWEELENDPVAFNGE